MTLAYRCDDCKQYFGGKPFFRGGVGMRDDNHAEIVSTAAYDIGLCQGCAHNRFPELVKKPQVYP